MNIAVTLSANRNNIQPIAGIVPFVMVVVFGFLATSSTLTIRHASHLAATNSIVDRNVRPVLIGVFCSLPVCVHPPLILVSRTPLAQVVRVPIAPLLPPLAIPLFDLRFLAISLDTALNLWLLGIRLGATFSFWRVIEVRRPLSRSLSHIWVLSVARFLVRAATLFTRWLSSIWARFMFMKLIERLCFAAFSASF